MNIQQTLQHCSFPWKQIFVFVIHKKFTITDHLYPVPPEGLITTVSTTSLQTGVDSQAGNSSPVTVSSSMHIPGDGEPWISRNLCRSRACRPSHACNSPQLKQPLPPAPNCSTHRQGTVFKKKQTKLKSSSQITTSYGPASLLRGAFFPWCLHQPQCWEHTAPSRARHMELGEAMQGLPNRAWN